MIPWLPPEDLAPVGPLAPFPPTRQALAPGSPAPGLLCAGGNLGVRRLALAYSQGIFPWYGEGEPILWWSTAPRMVLPVADFRLHRSLKKTLRRFITTPGCAVVVDQDCEAVIRACAGTPREGQLGTWILPEMVEAYVRWHRTWRGAQAAAVPHNGAAAGTASRPLGRSPGLSAGRSPGRAPDSAAVPLSGERPTSPPAVPSGVHAFETRIDGRLVGGLYGVSIGRMFFGESMFALQPDTSKIALAALVAWCRRHGIAWIDCQQQTSHLASLGAAPVSREAFEAHLATACHQPGPEGPGDWTYDDSHWRWLPELAAGPQPQSP